MEKQNKHFVLNYHYHWGCHWKSTRIKFKHYSHTIMCVKLLKRHFLWLLKVFGNFLNHKKFDNIALSFFSFWVFILFALLGAAPCRLLLELSKVCFSFLTVEGALLKRYHNHSATSQWNSTFFYFALIIEGTTERVYNL